MKNKIILFVATLLLTFPSVVNGEYKISRNYLKLTEVSSNDSENIEVKNTDLTNKDNAKKLVVEINNREKFNKNEIKIAPEIKFKGGAEEIYTDYANSVVLIGNRNKWATGSGFFINHHGLKIITNWHVIEGTKNVDVWLKPKQKKEVDYLLNNVDSYKGKVVKTNKKKDLAMVEIKGISHRIKPVSFGSINKVKEGQMGFAIGHPQGLGWTFTSGMISAIRPDYSWPYENSKHYASVIQTQTPINQGNSGGPLFNKKKELIGVNTFTTAKAENLNFAVSVDDLLEFINEAQQEEIESQYIKKKKKGPTWIKKKKKSRDGKSSSNSISKKYPNAKKNDANKNGITDVWFVDENNNGRVDTVIMDLNENGIVESVGFDENENGNFEIIVFDDDEDGNVDRGDFDKNDDGTSDIIAYDYNQDGEWDKYENVS
tara:strand:+ start:2680 stop:3969 length:1290 start_codon:yes stop_codon:yes gene_type:complete